MTQVPTRSRYDLVVVGGGVAGLTTGALMARAGRSVLVVEAEQRPGGYARSVRAAGHEFDRAVHLVMGGNRTGPLGPGLVTQVLDLLDVDDLCELVPVEPFYRAIFPGFSLDVPTGGRDYVEAHAERFPDDAAGFAELATLTFAAYEESLRFPIRPRAVDWLTVPMRFPTLARHRNHTVAQVTQRLLTDPRLRTVHYAVSAYLGLPASRAPFTYWATMMGSYVEEGAFACRGSFQRLADALAAGLRGHSGELLLGRRVETIELDGGRVVAVVLDDGERVVTDHVVSAVDARDTFTRMLDPRDVPRRWTRRIQETETSMEVASVYLGTDLDVAELGVTQETVVYRTWDIEEVYLTTAEERPLGVTVTIPTLTDPTMAPAGQHQVVVSALAPPATGDDAKLSVGLVEAAEEVVPGLSDHVVVAAGTHGSAGDPSSPPVHRLGPAYGWAVTPEAAGPRRLPQVTPVDGLTLAGQWTQPGHGIWTVMASGVRAARLLLDRDPTGGLYPLAL